MEKLVVSGSLRSADWNNSQLVTDLNPDEIEDLKRMPGRGILIYGSLSVVNALAPVGLIDEYHLLVHPTFLGEGKRLFESTQQPAALELISADPFPSGVVLLKYAAGPAGLGAGTDRPG